MKFSFVETENATINMVFVCNCCKGDCGCGQLLRRPNRDLLHPDLWRWCISDWLVKH